MAMDEFLSSHARRELAADLNTLLASPQFRAWRSGPTLDVASWMEPLIAASAVGSAHGANGATHGAPTARTPVTIVSVAHLDDDERVLVLGVILEEVLTWVRSLQGSQRLRALIVFDAGDVDALSVRGSSVYGCCCAW